MNRNKQKVRKKIKLAKTGFLLSMRFLSRRKNERNREVSGMRDV
jgi:hypothetical protein